MIKEILLKLPYKLFLYLTITGIIANISVIGVSLLYSNHVLVLYCSIILVLSIIAIIIMLLSPKRLKTSVHMLLLTYYIVFLHASFSTIGYLPLTLVFPIIIGLSFVFYENFYIKVFYCLLCCIAAVISSSLQLQFIETTNNYVLLSSGLICLFLMIAFSLLTLLQSTYYLEHRIALEENEKKLIEQKKVLEKYIQSNIKLEQFAHIAAHDLKSPLRSISSFSGLLKLKTSHKLSIKELEYVDFIESSTTKMNELVEDLLVFSAVNAQELKLSNFNLQHLIDEVLSNLEFQITKEKVIINVMGCDVNILADRIKLRQVFQNLISNSIKFRASDRIPEITLIYRETQSTHFFAIADNGIGILDKYKSKVFKEFKQLHPEKYEGTGMGLGIVKNIINRHYGTIEISDNLPFGLKVEFTILKNMVKGLP